MNDKVLLMGQEALAGCSSFAVKVTLDIPLLLKEVRVRAGTHQYQLAACWVINKQPIRLNMAFPKWRPFASKLVGAVPPFKGLFLEKRFHYRPKSVKAFAT